MTMKRTVLIEGMMLLVLSFVGLGEAIRLISDIDPHTVYDALGPGYYILFLANKKVRTDEEIKRYLNIIKDKLKQIETKQKTAELVAKKVDEVKKDYKIEIHSDRIE